MGKAQSKRSLEITTETKKDAIEEGTGKMEKIEDVDQLKPQVNGDTHHNDTESNDKEKTAETENEKDLSTEKDQQQQQHEQQEPQKPHTEGGGGGDDGAVEQKTVENGNDETLNESKASAEASAAATENDESSKKKKKNKKWSFRSISFGKKDKQKPAKKEETVNGECEKVPEETNDETAATKDGENKPEENTPNVDDKPQNDEGKVEEKSEITPATNGISENTPDQPSTEQKTPEVAVPSTDEKKVTVETVNNDDKQKSDTVAENVDVSKTNEQQQEQPQPPATTKIEVKEENVPVESNLQNKNDETNVQNQQQQVESENAKNLNVVDDGDSENAQNLIPPPLPCIPPPSQVMVFALGDIKENEQEQLQLIQQQQLEVIQETEVNTIKSPESTVEASDEPQAPKQATDVSKANDEKKPENIADIIPATVVSIGNDQIESVNIDKTESSPTTENSAVQEVENKNEIIQPQVAVVALEVEKISATLKSEIDIPENREKLTEKGSEEVNNEAGAEKDSKVEVQEKEVGKASVQFAETIPELQVEKNIEDSNAAVGIDTLDIKKSSVEEPVQIPSVINTENQPVENNVEQDINPEQIAQTIALIDEVTQEAASITQQKLSDPNASDIILKQNDENQIELENKVPELSSNASHPQDSTNSESKVPEKISNSNTQSSPEPSNLAQDNIKNEIQQQGVHETQEQQPQQQEQQKQEDIKQNEARSTKPTGDVIGDIQEQSQKECSNEKTVSNSDIPKDCTQTNETIEKISETIPAVIDQLKSIADDHVENEKSTQNETKSLDNTDISTNVLKEDSKLVADDDTNKILEDKTTTDDKLDTSNGTNLKENGIGENHEQPSETSATESLNGQLEHKTAEEIKAEITEKTNAETLETSAETVKTTE